MDTNYCPPVCQVWEVKSDAVICNSGELNYGSQGAAGKPIDEDDVINGGIW